jgi:hypothetical protein
MLHSVKQKSSCTLRTHVGSNMSCHQSATVSSASVNLTLDIGWPIEPMMRKLTSSEYAIFFIDVLTFLMNLFSICSKYVILIVTQQMFLSFV